MLFRGHLRKRHKKDGKTERNRNEYKVKISTIYRLVLITIDGYFEGALSKAVAPALLARVTKNS